MIANNVSVERSHLCPISYFSVPITQAPAPPLASTLQLTLLHSTHFCQTECIRLRPSGVLHPVPTHLCLVVSKPARVTRGLASAYNCHDVTIAVDDSSGSTNSFGSAQLDVTGRWYRDRWACTRAIAGLTLHATGSTPCFMNSTYLLRASPLKRSKFPGTLNLLFCHIRQPTIG